MPLDATLIQLPCGARAVRLNAHGVITLEESQAYLRRLEPGGDLYNLPTLVETYGMESVTPEARRNAAAYSGTRFWVAVIVKSAVLRVTISFLIRVQRTSKIRLFSGESEALKFLDGKVQEGLAGKPS